MDRDHGEQLMAELERLAAAPSAVATALRVVALLVETSTVLLGQMEISVLPDETLQAELSDLRMWAAWLDAHPDVDAAMASVSSIGRDRP